MTIRIGRPVLIGAERAGKALLAAGIVGIGYGALASAGMVADMLSQANLAQHIAQFAEPVTNSILNAANARGFEPSPDAPGVIRIGLAMFATLPFAIGSTLAGEKLRSAAARALSDHETGALPDNATAPITRLASRLRGIVSGIKAGSLNHEHEAVEEEPGLDAQGMR